MYDPELYRTKDEVEQWKKRDPIECLAKQMQTGGDLSPAELDEIEKKIAAEISEAVDFAEGGTWEPLEDLTRFVYSDRMGA